ncbi:putative cullin 2 [Trypanosoma conorhini]|uniref:Putative cullin 2 n=1 Tax=Trypanosoma conorhini TaxID=83891 RepID=A0A3R7LKQ8_9TRYP|nr:putative cullin 2 [Trypanosoma conorhini]RNF16299.1 putative cullin 2 [Trypanosoma conorhini]
MRRAPNSDDSHRDFVSAYSGPLFATTFDFGVLWNKVENVCKKILGWTDSPEFVGQTAIQQVVRAYTVVYRLVSVPCLDCPKLVRGTNSQQDPIEGRSEGRQALVVYYLLRETIRKRLSSVVTHRLKLSLKAEPPTLLHVYLSEWKTFLVAVNHLKVVFSYLHSPWQKRELPSDQPLLPTEVVALVQWSDIIMSPEICGSLTEQIFSLISQDRLHRLDEESTRLVRDLSHSLAMLNDPRHTAYSSLIEESYLVHLQRFYKENINLLKTGGILSYIERSLLIFEDETERVNRLLNKCTMLSMLQRLAEVLIDSEIQYFKSYLSEWILNNNGYLLNKMYQLLSKNSTGVLLLKETFEKSVFEKGLDDVSKKCEESMRSNENLYSSVIEEIISVHRHFEKVNESFEGNGVLETAMLAGLEKILRALPYLRSYHVLGEELARFVHTKLKSIESRKDCEALVKEVVTVFQLLPSKSSFLESYPKYLSARLLFDAYSDEYELLAILIISQASDCTSEFVYRCEVMLTDVTESSASLRDTFDAKYGNTHSTSTTWSFQPSVLTSYSWPDASCDVQLPTPRILLPKLEEFQLFYSQVRPKRHITFVPRYSRGWVKMNLPRGSRIPSIDLCVGQSQLLLTECFNSQTEWPMLNLLQAMGVTNNELFLSSLNAFAGYGILECYNENGPIGLPLKSVMAGQFVRLGSNPDVRKRKLNLFPSEWEGSFQATAVSSNDLANDPVDASHHMVDQLKAPAVQATLARVFKANLALSFSGLMEKVKEESMQKFVPSVQQVKAALEFLISRGFVIRDGSEAGLFLYVY